MPGTELDKVCVMVTRPAHQADPLCRLIEREGGTVVRFPVLEILDPEDSGPLLDIIDRLDEFNIAIFISPNAVDKAMNLIGSRRELPRGLTLATVGKSSAVLFLTE